MAGDQASIGDVYVDVLPKADSFWARFQAETRPQASRIGDDLGTIISKALADKIAAGMADGIDKGSRSGIPRSTRAGEESGGAFADSFKKRVEAALKALPDISIGANSSEAERRITELRARLDELTNRRVGVNIDAAAAQAELTAIRTELERLNADAANVQVRVDAGRAAAELAAFSAEVDRLDGRDIHVNADDSEVKKVGDSARESSSGIGMLMAAGIALGPGIIPVAGAAAAAVAGIGVGALGAAAGLGVVGLAVSGVVGAVKAMGAANDSAGQAALSQASRQSSLASAVDQVRSAQASLANTTANAADSERRAAEQLSNAETSLAQAQQNALRAQAAINDAREQAKRTLEDLNNSVADGALAQRRAVLDLQKAQQELQAVQANPAATQQQRAEAQLAYDEAKQHIVDLGTKQQQLVDDQAKAQKAGIDGSTQVVAAQRNITQANDAVRKAEQAVADARAAQTAQARQNAFAIAQAQQSVVAAQRQVQQASVQAGTDGSSAMTKLQQTMANLSPEGQRFATFLYGLRTPLLDLRRTAEAGFLPGAQQGLTDMLTLLPTVNTEIRTLSGTAGDLATKAGAAFSAPYWRDWITFVGNEANTALPVFAGVLYNSALGVSALVRAAAPIGNDFGGGLLRFSEQFAQHALTVQNTAGYRSFLDYVRVQGPIVAHTIGDVVTAVVRLVEAIAPLGGTSLTILRLLATTINALPVPVLTALAGGIGLVVTGLKLLDFKKSITDSGLFKGAVDVLTSAVQNAKLNMTLAEGQTGRFGIALQGLKGAGQGAGSAIGALASSIGPGGLLAGGIGVAVVGLGILAQKMAEQKAKTEQAIAAYERFGDAVAKARAAGEPDNAAEMIRQDKALQDLIQNSQRYGVSAKSVVDALSGQRSAFTDVNTALAAHRAELVRTIQEHTTQGGKGQKVMDDTALAASNEVQHLDALSGKFGKVASDQANATDAANLYNKSTGDSAATQQSFVAALTHVQAALTNTSPTADQFKTAINGIGSVAADAASKAGAFASVSDRVATSNLSASEKASAYRDVLNGLGAATDTQGPTFDALSRTFGNIATSELSAKDKADLLKQSLDLLYGAAISQDHAQETLVSTQASLSTQLQQNSLGFDLKTAKTQADSQAIVENRHSLEDALQATRDKYVADVAAAAGTADEAAAVAKARDEHDKATTAILNQIDPTYRNSAAVQDLVKHFGEIPPAKSTQVSAPGLDDAISKLVEAHVVNLALSKSPPWDRSTIQSEIRVEMNNITGHAPQTTAGLADGGLVPGPWQGPKADNVLGMVGGTTPIRINPREFVQPVASVDYYGTHVMEAMRTRQIPREMFAAGGLIPRFADGGLAGWPVTIPLSFQPPDVAAAWQKWRDATAVVSAPGGGGSVDRWTPVVLSVLAALGQPSSLLGAVLRRINFESGGNPTVVNTTDGNWYAGHPSVGLAQVIAGTYRQYVGGFDRGPYSYGVSTDPFANIYAGMRYAINRYGSISSIDPLVRPYGYDSGGDLPPGLTLAYNGTGRPESVFTEGQLAELKAGGGTTIHMPVYGSDGQSVHELAKAVAAELAWQMR